MKIVHRDIKPKNILIHSQQPFVVKLADFGLSEIIEKQEWLKTYCGTQLYCAPRYTSNLNTTKSQQKNNGNNRYRNRGTATFHRYDPPADVWSLGCVLFYSLTGESPLPAGD